MEGFIREAKYRRFSGTAYTLGRATMGLPIEDANTKFRQFGLEPVGGFARADQVDTVTLASSDFGFQPIRDTEFFRMLGFDELKAVDISDHEGAEIIFDLNREVPPQFAGTCDFLVDASTLDNVFDPVTALRNAAKLLKPDGRICVCVQANFSTWHGGIPYLNITPLWLYDWFTINGFVDCQVYVTVWTPKMNWTQSTFMLDHEYATRRHAGGIVKPIVSEFPIGVFVFAARDERSTADRIPTQHAYRGAAEWDIYEAAVQSFVNRQRQPHQRSSEMTTTHAVPPGWLRVLPDWSVEDPQTGRRLEKTG
jgi:SAM-dependent methyltransferase